MKLKIENICKEFNKGKDKKVVLENISFEVEEGQFVTLLGPSGCGKTTLLTIMAGFQKATSGSVSLNNNKVLKPGPDRGFVFQNYALFPWMTVRDNILYPLKQQKTPKDKQEKRLQELLSMAHLEDAAGLFPAQLSGGMKQRTAVVRALASFPEILLMDEPLGAIDFQMRQKIQEELETLWLKAGITVVMVTHDIEEAIYLSDRIIVMSTNHGAILDDIYVKLPRPRDREGLQYAKYKKHLSNVLKGALENEKNIENKILAI